MASERVKLKIGSVARAVLVTGQAYQDPKDALNEFVSNAADEYAEIGRAGGRVRIVLKRRGRYPTIAIDDCGRGMSPDRLRQVTQNLFKSVKAGDDRTLGEKAIGLLAFQQLAARMDIVSRAEGSDETWCLRLERGAASAQLDRERRRHRSEPGTTIYLGQLDQEVLRMLTQRKIVDYLRKRRGVAIESGAYEIEVAEGKRIELVTPEEPDGVPVPLRTQSTLWGPIEFALHVAPADGSSRGIAVVGRAGTTIIDDLTEMEELDQAPWNSNQVSGRITFAALHQSAGRRAILRDDEAWPVFKDALEAVRPAVQTLVDRVRREVDQDTADRLTDEIRKVFASVLRELDDIDNPMRTPTGGLLDPDGPGTGKAGEAGKEPSPSTTSTTDESTETDATERDTEPTIDELAPEAKSDGPEVRTTGDPKRRGRRLPSLEPDPSPTSARSRFEPDERIVLYNESHPDYLMVKGSESDLVDYLATLVAKEYVVYNNPLSGPEELAEEMVRMVIRVRRHLSKRR